jgi:hypothetical protein
MQFSAMEELSSNSEPGSSGAGGSDQGPGRTAKIFQAAYICWFQALCGSREDRPGLI